MISSSSLDASPLLEGITTFYSYKGGTGRSMALANVACLLGQAEKGNKILAVDWDLEAPGLHYYLLDPEQSVLAAQHPGVVDLFAALQKTLNSQPASEVDELFHETELSNYIMATRAPNVFLMPAGVIDADYQTKLKSLDWQRMYIQCPDLYQGFADRLNKNFGTVLIDSRTGMTDTSNICTCLLPDKLVVVFTPNRQSLTGVEALIQQSIEYRRRSADLRPLIVYPLPSRIDQQNESIRERWRRGDEARKIEGFEPQFERILKNSYGLSKCSLARYFNLIQLQHSPEYSYGEPVVTLDPESSDRFSLLQSYKSLVDWLISSAAPWEDPQIGKDRKRLELLKLRLESEVSIRSGREYVETLRSILDLTLKLNGEDSLYTLNATKELVEASLIDSADRPNAFALLENLIARFETSSSAYKCLILECLLRSAGILRGLKEDSQALSIRLRAVELLERDYSSSGHNNFTNFIAISERLVRAKYATEARVVLEFVIRKLSENNASVDIEVQALNGLLDAMIQEDNLQGSLDTLRKIGQLVRQSDEVRNFNAMRSIEKLAIVLASLKDLQTARKYEVQLITVAREDFGIDPNEATDSQGAVRKILQRLGEVGDYQAEIKLAERHASEARDKAALSPTDLSRQFDFVRSLVFLGDKKSQGDQYNEALQIYLEALSTIKRVSATPDNQGDRPELEAEIQRKIESTRLQTVAGGRV